jgi:hypothetical protein
MSTNTTMYIAMILNYWGRGATPVDALNAARKVGGQRKVKALTGKRIIFSYDPAKTTECYIDDMGSINWLGERPARCADLSSLKE